MGRVRVMHLLHKLGAGGAERNLLRLMRDLRDEFEFAVCAMVPGGEFEAAARELDVPLFDLGMTHSSRLPVKGMFRLRKILGSWRPQVLHSWLFYANLMGRVVGRLAGVPVRISEQRNVDPWRRRRHVLADRWTARWATVIVSNSEAGRRRLIETEKLPAHKVMTIHSGLSGEDWPPPPAGSALRDRLKLPAGAPLLAVVASFKHQKGHAVLMRALPAILRRHPGVQVLLAGVGRLRDGVASLADELDVSGAVRFLGHQSVGELAELYAGCDLVVLPSLWEGLPATLIEAQIYAAPVVATDAGGTSELVVDGRTGKLVPPGDPQALAAAIGELLDDPEGSAALGRAGQERVRAEFSGRAATNAKRDLYRRLLAARSPDGPAGMPG